MYVISSFWYQFVISKTIIIIVARNMQVSLHISLQKQVGCFNHRVVALVADKLERQWSLEVCFDVED